MKSKQGRGKKEDPLAKLTDAERAALRYRQKLVDMIDDLQKSVRNAPAETRLPRESINGLLMACYYLLDLNAGLQVVTDEYLMKSAIRELGRALDPLGLGVDYSDKIHAWRMRDMKERWDTNFLIAE